MESISPRFFRLEFAVVASVCLLYAQQRVRYAGWSSHRTFLHFLLILVFAEIGACGIRTVIKLVFGNRGFVEVFQHPNLLLLPPNLMCWFAAAYGLVATVFFISVMFLGELNPKGYKVFTALVGPCTILYPAVMANLTHTSEILLASSFWTVLGVFTAFAVLAGVGAAFSRHRT